MKKKVLAILLAMSVVGMYSFSSVAGVFASNDTDSAGTTAQAAAESTAGNSNNSITTNSTAASGVDAGQATSADNQTSESSTSATESSTAASASTQSATEASAASASGKMLKSPGNVRYQAIFMMNNGTNSRYTSVTAKDSTQTITLPNGPKRGNGIVFKGWSTTKNGSPVTGTTVTLTANTTYYAVWEIKQYKAVFYMNDGTENIYKTVETTLGSYDKRIVTFPENPKRDGYDFMGWSSGSALGTPTNYTTRAISKDTAYYAVWMEKGAVSKWNLKNGYKGTSTTTNVYSKAITSVDEATDPSMIYYILGDSSITYVIPKGYKGGKITFDPYDDAGISLNKYYHPIDESGESSEIEYRPSDNLILKINVINKSDTDYSYLNDSLVVATKDWNNDSKLLPEAKTAAESFDGQSVYNTVRKNLLKYPGSTTNLTENDAVLAAISAQTGKNANDIKYGMHDSEKLKALNDYLSKNNLTLSQYYVKYYSKKYDVTDAKTLQDLPEAALLDMVQGGTPLAFNTDSDVNAALYNLFYNKLFSLYYVNGDGNIVDKAGNIVDENVTDANPYRNQNPVINYSYFTNAIGSYMRGTSDGTVNAAFNSIFKKIAGNTNSGDVTLQCHFTANYMGDAYELYNLFFGMNFSINAKTTYTVVTNYYTSNDNGANYTKDNAEPVQKQAATETNVGDTITASPEDAWATYNGNAYGYDASKSTVTKIAVLDPATNVLTLNYYRTVSNTTVNPPATTTTVVNTGSGSSGSVPVNNTTNKVKPAKTTVTAKASNNNSSAPKTGDQSDIMLWAALGMAGIALAGVTMALRRKEQ